MKAEGLSDPNHKHKRMESNGLYNGSTNNNSRKHGKRPAMAGEVDRQLELVTQGGKEMDTERDKRGNDKDKASRLEEVGEVRGKKIVSVGGQIGHFTFMEVKTVRLGSDLINRLHNSSQVDSEVPQNQIILV